MKNLLDNNRSVAFLFSDFKTTYLRTKYNSEGNKDGYLLEDSESIRTKSMLVIDHTTAYLVLITETEQLIRMEARIKQIQFDSHGAIIKVIGLSDDFGFDNSEICVEFNTRPLIDCDLSSNYATITIRGTEVDPDFTMQYILNNCHYDGECKRQHPDNALKKYKVLELIINTERNTGIKTLMAILSELNNDGTYNPILDLNPFYEHKEYFLFLHDSHIAREFINYPEAIKEINISDFIVEKLAIDGVKQLVYSHKDFVDKERNIL